MSPHEHRAETSLPDPLAMLALENHFKYGARADWRPHAIDVADHWAGEHARQG